MLIVVVTGILWEVVVSVTKGVYMYVWLLLRYHGEKCTKQCPGYLVESDDIWECSGYGDCVEDESNEWKCECDYGYS